jgi:hypothetical protein
MINALARRANMHKDAMRNAIRNIMVIIDENDEGLIKLC